MKQILTLLAVFSACCGSAGAQANRSWGIYGGLQITKTQSAGLHGSINVHWHRKHALGFGLAWIDRNATNLPKDSGQYAPRGLFFTAPNTISESFYLWTLSYSRYLPIDREGTLRLRLQAGLSAGLYDGPKNFHLVNYPATTGFLGYPAHTSYEYDYVRRNLYGITLEPALEYAPGRGFGFTAGAIVSINNQRFCTVAEFGLLFGRVRNRGYRSRPAEQR